MDSQRPHTPEAVAACEARHARRLAMLGEMAEIGMAICRDLGRRVAAEKEMAEMARARARAEGAKTEGAKTEGAKTEGGEAEEAGAAGSPAPPRAGVDVELKFHRISRAVRQTLALEAKLESDLEANAVKFKFQRETAIRDASDAAVQAMRRKAEHQFQVHKAVRRAINDQASDSDYERLIEALDARITLCRDDRAFEVLPVGDCVSIICASLGLKADPAYWAGHDLWRGDEDEDEEEDEDAPAETDARTASEADDEDDEAGDDPGGSPDSRFGSPHRHQAHSVSRGLRPLSAARPPNRSG